MRLFEAARLRGDMMHAGKRHEKLFYPGIHYARIA